MDEINTLSSCAKALEEAAQDRTDEEAALMRDVAVQMRDAARKIETLIGQVKALYERLGLPGSGEVN